MAEWKPVRIPYKDGKTVIASRGASRYVLYETEQKYDPGKQYYIPIRKVIGTQIPEQPEFMLPNEKYRELFPDINASKNMELENYVRERDRTARARAYFDQVYFEFMMLSRRMPERRLSANKARRINRVLRPMMELLETAGMADMLEQLPEGEKDGAAEWNCSDAGLLFTLWKTAVNRYFQERRSG